MKTKIKNTLQLDKKWVKIMLTVSVIVIVVLSFYPENGFHTNQKAAQRISIEEMSPEMEEAIVDSLTTDRLKSISRPDMVRRAPASLDTASTEEATESPEPIIIQIVKEKEDFNWKEMISWIIGGMNGMVLLVMNLKNLKKK